MQEKVNRYLTGLLTHIEVGALSTDEQKRADRDMVGFIFEKLMRKKFRRRVSEETRGTVARKVAMSVKSNKPIFITVPFGGYKHFWNPSHPNTDWAELFHLRYMTDYVMPILAAYKPGVVLDYSTEDLILPRMNNYPDSAIEDYAKSFKQVINWYKQYIPKNLELRYWRVSERTNKQAIIDKVESMLPERLSAFKKLTPEQQQSEIHRSQRSVWWSGKKDLTGLSEKEKQDRIIESRLIELAFYDTEAEPQFMGDYWNDAERICVCFSFGLSPDNDEFGALTLQTAPGSIVDHWIGRGVVKRDGDKLYGTIVSQQQYGGLKPEVITVNSPPLSSKNYQTIEIV